MFVFALQAGNAEKDCFVQIESDQIKTAMYEDCIYIFENYSLWQKNLKKISWLQSMNEGGDLSE